MARSSTAFVCQSCGASHPKWAGRCDDCGAWNSLVEEAAPPIPSGAVKRRHTGKALDFVDLGGTSEPAPRMLTHIAEFDRVAGGGLVPGSALLIGGDPGIGKSTILLQAVARMAQSGIRTAYISGEEAIDQVRLRAARLGLAHMPVALATATALSEIIPALEATDGPQVVVIDSIQTMYVDTLDSAPGTVAQVRTCAQELIRLAKRRGFAVVLVGHVTKEGAIAGPRVLEHMVDTVMYFEGERGHQFRILRAVKNRFGPTDEIGVFEMTEAGLIEVPNPSALFLAERRGDVAGSAVFAGMEGTRPLLVEIQALVAPSSLGTPRRAVVGWDTNRLAMIMAVLDARCGLALGGNDVYLNVAGGLRITEPAADLAVAAALVSSLYQTPLSSETVVFGEIGLAGEVRQVGQADARLKEAVRLGFERAIVPASRSRRRAAIDGLTINEIDRLAELVDLLTPAEAPPRHAGPQKVFR
jgi:DNA repair protein RadA/Sms